MTVCTGYQYRPNLIALVLTAWQYRWRHVILFSGGIALFTLGLHVLFSRPGGASLLPLVTVLVIQTVSFVVVGYFVSALMSRNVAHHANAQTLTVQLAVNGPGVSLLVRDDGLGFNLRRGWERCWF